MEIKKSAKADLEKKKSLYMQIGLVFTLAVLLLAFDWKSYDKVNIEVTSHAVIQADEDLVIQTDQSAPPPPPPPADMSTEIDIVENNVKIEKEVEINAEADEKTVVQTVSYVAPSVEEEVVAEEEVFAIVEEMPSFPGGEEAIHTFITKNMSYPIVAQESGIQGKVYVSFVVEKDGRISNVKVVRGIGGGCDEEAIRVVKLLPKWNPGKQRGRAVRVTYSIPLVFNLG